jgi:hypothetical protein
LAEHSTGVAGWRASKGKAGAWGGGITGGVDALGCDGFNATLQAVSSITCASGSSLGSADLSLGMGLDLLVLGAPLRLGLAGLLGGRGQGQGSSGALGRAVGALLGQGRAQALGPALGVELAQVGVDARRHQQNAQGAPQQIHC